MYIPTQYIEITYKNNPYRLACKLRTLSASKATLLFLPGISCAKEYFDGAFTAEGLGSYSILTLDFLGFGTSDRPDNFPYTLEGHTAITKLLIHTLDLDYACLNLLAAWSSLSRTADGRTTVEGAL
jgi:pimeloyl-ACP methyl ester carboxylesterase